MGWSSFEATNARLSRAVRARRPSRVDWLLPRAGACFAVVFLADVLEFAGACLTLVDLDGLAAGSAPAFARTCADAAGTGGFAVEGALAAGVAVDCAAVWATAETNSNTAKAGIIANTGRNAGGVKRVGEGMRCIVTLYAGLDASERRGESLA